MSIFSPSPDDKWSDDAPGMGAGRRDTRRLWLLLLAGPLTWSIHFMMVYLLVEATCGIDSLGFTIAGQPGAKVVVLVLTSMGMLATAWFGFLAARRWRLGQSHGDAVARFAGLAAMLLSGLFLLAIASVGLPAIALPTC